MEHFNLEAPADVFVGAARKNARQPMAYRRFETGAEAVRHVIEAIWQGAQTDGIECA